MDISLGIDEIVEEAIVDKYLAFFPALTTR